MLSKLRKFIEKESLFTKEERLLLAISGGKDSMVMLHLFKQLDYDIGVAHFNHKLRGDSSDLDEEFVRNYCEQIDLPFYSNSDHKDLTPSKSKNVQDKARDERYSFLNYISNRYDFDKILTAHHAMDNIETFLLQMSRGAGLDGLSSIRPLRCKRCRPILFATRSEIDTYYTTHGLSHREDESNEKDTYRRNYIRKHILPHFSKLNAQWEKTMHHSISNIHDANQLLNRFIAKQKSKFITESKDRCIINKPAFLKMGGNQTLLYSILNPYKFTPAQIQEIYSHIFTKFSGAQWLSESHELLDNREEFILYPKNQSVDKGEYIINQLGIFDWNNINIGVQQVENYVHHESPYIEIFSMDALQFPLKMRRWQSGDSFRPLGMDGKKKKVKKYLIDKKISRLDKNQVLVLTSNEKIAWVIGHRLDERFKARQKGPYVEVRITKES